MQIKKNFRLKRYTVLTLPDLSKKKKKGKDISVTGRGGP
jgi:hypothetical protein